MADDGKISESRVAVAPFEAAVALPAPWRALIIDDEPAIGRLVRNLLGHHDIEVATSAELGLARLRDAGARYDVIVCDVMMPELSGMDLYDTLAIERPAIAKRFVFITGGAFTERASSFLARVPNRHLDKPFTIDALEAAMAETIAEASRRLI
jgi:CheY-like chemotaxis protein